MLSSLHQFVNAEGVILERCRVIAKLRQQRLSLILESLFCKR
jgi:hypothetical protein